MKNQKQPVDCNGNAVFTGDKIKLLKLSESLLSEIPEEEAMILESMIGKIFQIDEIDEFGNTWVNLCVYHGKGMNECHSYNLDSGEMELIQKNA